jgi:hypothetical protein
MLLIRFWLQIYTDARNGRISYVGNNDDNCKEHFSFLKRRFQLQIHSCT